MIKGGKSLRARIFEARTAYLFLLPLMGLLVIFNYYPPISGLYRSLFNWDAAFKSEFIGFDNFRELFKDQYFIHSIPTMFKIMIPKLLINIVVPLIAAEMIFCVKSAAARYAYRVAILLPIVAPGVVGLLVWKFMYDPINGPITALARLFGILDQGEIVSWLGDPKIVIPSIIFLGFPWVGGTSVLIYMSGLMNISSEMIESSRLDSANIMQRIFKIDIPMILGQIKYFLVFGIIGGLQDYGIQIILTRGGPGYATYVPGYYMYLQAFNNGRMGYASAIGTIMFFVILSLTIVNYRFFNTENDI
ncbi:MAG: sugar ABC transporter permease [Treponema sp.]|jgi:ABC-type sugar transport system permease subunit|nr:sugar ABC transporter permease [Treponema sp.]